jgi:hypothetical protein
MRVEGRLRSVELNDVSTFVAPTSNHPVIFNSFGQAASKLRCVVSGLQVLRDFRPL